MCIRQDLYETILRACVWNLNSHWYKSLAIEIIGWIKRIEIKYTVFELAIECQWCNK